MWQALCLHVPLYMRFNLHNMYSSQLSRYVGSFHSPKVHCISASIYIYSGEKKAFSTVEFLFHVFCSYTDKRGSQHSNGQQAQEESVEDCQTIKTSLFTFTGLVTISQPWKYVIEESMVHLIIYCTQYLFNIYSVLLCLVFISETISSCFCPLSSKISCKWPFMH